MKYFNNKNTTLGFTLLELIIVVAIMAILAGLATPSMRSFIRNQMIVGAITDLSSDIKYARSESVTKKTTVEICPSTNGINCVTSDNWAIGWIIYFTDADKCPATNDCVLKVHRPLNAALTLNASASSGVVFDDQGITPSSTTFALCDKDRSASTTDIFLRTLILKTSGSSYVRKGASSCDP